jgi:hypothetical protein
VTTARRQLPCVHLGPVVERATCNCRRKDTYACAAGVNNGRVRPAEHCDGCARYVADGPRADLFGDDPVELWPGFPDPLPTQFVPDQPAHWWKDAGVRRQHVEAFRAAVGIKPDKATWTKEAGIVTAGGGDFYWPQVVTLVRTLREVGCTLPIEVWYRGDQEPVREADVAGMGVELCDTVATGEMLGDNRCGRHIHGWAQKIYALVHSSFRRALFLDADVYAAADPTFLIGEIERHGFVYWRDQFGAEKHVTWAMIWPDGRRVRGLNERVQPVQGGQMGFDRGCPDAWRTLLLTHWLCQHSEYVFRAAAYGDQDCARIALAATGGRHRCLGVAEWRSPAFVCSLDGKELLVHRCGKKFQLDNLPGAARALYHYACAVQPDRP